MYYFSSAVRRIHAMLSLGSGSVSFSTGKALDLLSFGAIGISYSASALGEGRATRQGKND